MVHQADHRWIARLLAAMLALALVPAATVDCDRTPPPAAAAAAVPALDARHEPLRAQFDAASGSPRVLLLASPT